MECVLASGLLDFMLSNGSGTSQVTQEERLVKRKVTKEWSKNSTNFLLTMCTDKYCEYERKPFREKNWVDFVGKLNVEFSQEPQRSW